MCDNKLHSEQLGKGVAFSRIRRITGYLTGTLDTWNSSKVAELNDRVKHGTDKVEVRV